MLVQQVAALLLSPPWKLTHGSGLSGHSGRQVTAAGWAAQVG